MIRAVPFDALGIASWLVSAKLVSLALIRAYPFLQAGQESVGHRQERSPAKVGGFPPETALDGQFPLPLADC